MKSEEKSSIVILKPSIKMNGRYPSLADQVRKQVASGYSASAKRIRDQCREVILTDGDKAWQAEIQHVKELDPKSTGGKKRVRISFGKPTEISLSKVPVMPRGSNNVRYG